MGRFVFLSLDPNDPETIWASCGVLEMMTGGEETEEDYSLGEDGSRMVWSRLSSCLQPETWLKFLLKDVLPALGSVSHKRTKVGKEP